MRTRIRTNARYTRDGLTWPEIAALLGYRQGSLEATVSRFRRGLWAPALNRLAELDAAMERLILAEGVVTVPAIARSFGLKPCTAQRRLARRGLDREMREELVASSHDLRRAA